MALLGTSFLGECVSVKDVGRARARDFTLLHSSKSLCGKLKGKWFHGKKAREGNARVRRDFGGFHPRPVPKKSESPLKSIIQEIEPLDVSFIGKDVSPDSTDAMKRTISGMLGLLPSDQFQVVIESAQEPLARLLVSSMMTGYTLCNGEYRLCLKRSLENSDESPDDHNDRVIVEQHMMGMLFPVSTDRAKQLVEEVDSSLPINEDSLEKVLGGPEQGAPPEELGAVSSEVAHYIQQLQAKLATTAKELEECKHALTTLEMESLAGEENNNLLEYLRSLEPEKVAELSQPTSPDVETVISEVVDGLLANLCLDNAAEVQSLRDGMTAINKPWQRSKASEVLGNLPLQIQANVTASRDFLARLLFWSMLLGHYMRAVEYRLELSRTLSISGGLVLAVEEADKARYV